eukprot:CAMPEP_0197034612 /NCGR_PEP_ID=MMETSP1384-20130603/12677_1 /TAXON_ID=29189 /ORGANISM="Ammonia sp." /LENGTH=249 /DNA_ID=CAMNT_0042464561 /DNA_START=25 /DNA_END=770 /DNA_ORIENTATION=+
MDIYGMFAMWLSIISIAAYFLVLLIQFNYTSSDAKSYLFSWRISSLSISANANYYRNKSEILKKYLVQFLDLNCKYEQLDILPATQYYDTDIGGLTVYVLLTSKTSKSQDDYLRCIEELIVKQVLSKKVKSMWNLPEKEEVNCYRVQVVQTLSVMTTNISMASFTYDKHSELASMHHHHLKVNSGSAALQKIVHHQEEEEEEKRELEGSEESESSLNTDDTDNDHDGIGGMGTRKERTTKNDFVVVSTG